MRSVEWCCVTSKKPLKCATPFLPLALKPSSFFFNNQMMCGCGSVACTQSGKGEGWGVLWNGQKAGGLSLRVKRDERMGGLVVGRGGCECHGLVSNTLSLSMPVTSTHPSMVSHRPVCFKAIVLLPLQSVCWSCGVVPLLPFVQFPSH